MLNCAAEGGGEQHGRTHQAQKVTAQLRRAQREAQEGPLSSLETRLFACAHSLELTSCLFKLTVTLQVSFKHQQTNQQQPPAGCGRELLVDVVPALRSVTALVEGAELSLRQHKKEANCHVRTSCWPRLLRHWRVRDGWM